VDYELTVAGVRASDGLREALGRMVSGRPLDPDDPLDERMQERLRTAAALSRFAVRLGRRARREREKA
jgi:hypothetical protein